MQPNIEGIIEQQRGEIAAAQVALQQQIAAEAANGVTPLPAQTDTVPMDDGNGAVQ